MNHVFMPDMKKIETDGIKRDFREVKKLALTKAESIYLYNTVSTSITDMKEYADVYSRIQEMELLQEKARVITQAYRSKLSDIVENMDDARIEELRKTQPVPKSVKAQIEGKEKVVKSSSDKAADQREKAIQSVMQALNYDRPKAEKFVDSERK